MPAPCFFNSGYSSCLRRSYGASVKTNWDSRNEWNKRSHQFAYAFFSISEMEKIRNTILCFLRVSDFFPWKKIFPLSSSFLHLYFKQEHLLSISVIFCSPESEEYVVNDLLLENLPWEYTRTHDKNIQWPDIS